jgi:hypothetical protein
MAFSSCPIENLTLPSSLTTIGLSAFSHNSQLEKLTLPSKLKTIKESAFYSCGSLKTVTIPALVTSIENSAFGETDNLTEIIMLPTVPPSIGHYHVFYATYSAPHASLKIKVPAASLSAYKNAPNWQSYASYIVANQ